MRSSIQLYHRAMAIEPSAKYWCDQLGISRNALATAKLRGRLSPTVAGNLARLLGEDIDEWIVIAALEAEPATYARNKLMTIVKAFHNA